MKFILASKSPRRKELLADLYPNFEILTEAVDESLPKNLSLSDAVAAIAERKGRAVLNRLHKLQRPDLDECIIISSDTMVEVAGVPLGKPKDEQDAYKMLSLLSGREHSVHTGIAVFCRDSVISSVATTKVFFKKLSEREILEYIKTGEPMDKAGAYGIQGGAGKFVEKIQGDFDTVVGLSRGLTKEMVERIISQAELKK